MSNKDTIKALKSFESTWAPAINSLPAVIATFEQLDFLEESKTKLNRDIESLQKQFSAVQTEWTKAEGEWQGRLQELQAQIAKTNVEVSTAMAEARKKINEQARKVKEAEATSAERVEALRVQAEDAKIKYEAEVGEAIAAANLRRADAEAAADEAEKRYAAASAKIEKLKSSLV